MLMVGLVVASLGMARGEDALPATALTKPTVHGPKRSSPDVPLPRHAYSPFEDLDAPSPYQPGPGRDGVLRGRGSVGRHINIQQ